VSGRRLEVKPTFEKLFADLKADDPSVRSEAAEALGKLRDPRAVGPLIQALADPDPYVCGSAIAGLGTLGDPRAVEPLVDALVDDERRVRYENFTKAGVVADALAGLGDSGFRALRRLLREHANDEYIGCSAVKTLAEIGGVRAIDMLVQALGSSVYEVGHAAARALWSLGEPALVPLVHAMRAEGSYAGSHAVDALTWIGTPAVPLLLNTMRDEQHSNTRYYAAQALGSIGDERAREPLRHALNDEDDGVRLQAALALSAMRDPVSAARIAPLLANLDMESYGLARQIREALTEIGEPAADPLAHVLADTGRSPLARTRAASLLGSLGDSSTIPVLAASLAGEVPDIRAAAALALGQLHAGETTEALYHTAQDESALVRSCALLALAQLGDERALPLLNRFVNELKVTAPERVADRGTMLNRAALAMSLLGDRGLEPLERMLEGDDHLEWFSATRALAQMGDAGLALLLRAGRDQRPLMRQVALMTLRHSYLHLQPDRKRDADLVETCIAALEDAESLAAVHAAGALGELGEPRAVEPLIRLLERRAAGSMHPNAADITAMSAARALERLGDPRAIPALMKTYKRAGHGDKRVYLEAANSIAQCAQEQGAANEK
jgi:HEAT repeat protein